MQTVFTKYSSNESKFFVFAHCDAMEAFEEDCTTATMFVFVRIEGGKIRRNQRKAVWNNMSEE